MEFSNLKVPRGKGGGGGAGGGGGGGGGGAGHRVMHYSENLSIKYHNQKSSIKTAFSRQH